MRLLIPCFAASFFLSLSPSSSFINKDSAMPVPLLIDILEITPVTLAELEENYLSFNLIRRSLSTRSAIVRKCSQKMMDKYLDCLRMVISKTPPSLKMLKFFHNEFKALHFFMKIGVGFYETSKGEKLDLFRSDQYTALLDLLTNVLNTHLRQEREQHLQQHKQRLYGEVYLTSLLLGNSLTMCRRLTLQPNLKALIDLIIARMVDQNDEKFFGTEYRPQFYYLLNKGVTTRIQFMALIYFLNIYPDAKTVRFAFEFVDEHIEKDLTVVEPILMRLIDKSPDVLVAVGKHNEKIKDINVQQRISQAMNKYMNIEERSDRNKR